MVFLGVVLAVLGALAAAHWYLWRRLVRDVAARGTWYRRIGTALVLLLPLTTVAAQVARRTGVPFPVERVLAWPGHLWLALLLYLLLGLLAGEAVRPVLCRLLERRDAARWATRPAERAVQPAAAGAVPPAGHAAEPPAASPAGEAAAEPPASDRPSGPSRRLFVARGVAAAAGLAAVGTVGHGTRTVLAGPKLKRVTVPLAKLPRAAHGYRIAVVSDIHLGAVLGRAHAERVVETVNRANADMVAVVGDLADGTVADLRPAAEPLSRLRSRDGAYFVTGNHEYFTDADAWVSHVRELGMRPLENARRELRHFDLAGVNDLAGEDEGAGPDFDAALGGRDPSRAVVLLAHQPVQIHEAVERGVDLQLSGHTHGGQMWPANHLAALANPTLAGLERYGDTQLYVSRGAGAWGPPVRVGAEPDVTVVELASRQA